ncbi:Titin-like, partial [Branchiostoma belcheri]
QPDPPKKFEVTETSPTHISLRWTKPDYDGGSRITSYIVEMRFTDSEEWVKCTQINALRYTITDVIPNQDYMLRIFAQNTGAMSNPKEIGPVTAKEPIMPATLDLSAIPGDEVIVKQGSDWTISIPYHGYPAPTAQWFRGMGDLRETNRVSTKTGGGVTMLNIRQVIKADGGKYSVQVSNPAGSQTADINVKIIGRPGPPNGPVVIEDVTPESCVLNWKPPTDDGGSDVTNYVIEKSDNRGATWVYVSSGVKRTQLKVTKLTENKEYLFKISAENRFGVGSPLKSESMVAKLPYDPPSEPRNPKVSEVQRDSMTITWEESASDGGSDITGYIVERKERNSNRWVKINRVPMKHLTVRSMGLLEGCEYEHRVIAYNAAGPSKHSEATPLTLAKDPVSAPRRVEIVDITRSSVSLEWLAPESEGGARIIGYWVDRFNPEEGKFITCNQIMIPASERHFTVKGLRQGSKYEFCVRAKNAAGIISAPSDKTIPVICKDDLQPPSVSLAYMTKDTMTFKAGEDMDLSMSVKGKPVPDIVWLKGIRPLVKSDRLTFKMQGKISTLSVRKVVRADSGEYTLQAKSLSGETKQTIKVSVMDVPGVPMDLATGEVTPEFATLTWQPPEDDGGIAVTSFTVERCEAKTPDAWMKVSSAVRKTSYKITRLTAGASYLFRVRAQNFNGIGPAATIGPIIAKWAFDVPTAPVNLKVSNVTKDSITITWQVPDSDGGSPITGYHIERKERTSVRWQRQTRLALGPSELTYLADDLIEDLDYEFRVIAMNAAGLSPATKATPPTMCTTPPGKPGKPINPECKDTTRSTVSLKWSPPEKDGGSRILGYVIEARKIDSEDWFKYVVENLTENDALLFRVSAVNMILMGDPEPVPGFVQVRDLTQPPEVFLDSSLKRMVKFNAGAPLRLVASIRGRPMPECRWEKEDSDLANRSKTETVDNITQLVIPSCDRRDAGRFDLTVENAHGSVTVAIMVKVMDTPGAPENIEVKGVTRSSCIVDWDPPSKDGGKPVNNYILEKRQVGRTTWTTVDANIVKTAYTISNLVEGNKYNFRIIAVNDFGPGAPGDTEEPILAQDPVDQPSLPKNVRITEITPTHISLRWTKPDYDGGSRITSYIVEKRFTDSEEWEKCTQINALRYTVADLIPNQEYVFRVYAQNMGAVSPPAEVGPVIAREQLAPGSIDVEALPSDEIVLKEGADLVVDVPFGGAPRPKVTWKKGMGELRETDRVSTKQSNGTAQLIFKKCMKADAGRYNITVENELGSQEADINIRVIGRPGAPAGPVDFEDVTPESLTMNWKAPTDDGGSDVSNYVVEKSDNRGATWTYVSMGVKRTSLRITKLKEYTEYLFRISAENKFGVGPPLRSNSVIAKYPYDVPAPPGQPQVSVLNTTKESMVVEWTASPDDGGSEITGYIVERRERTSQRWMKVNRGLIKKLSIQTTGLLEGKEYEFRIFAHNAAGASKPSENSPFYRAMDPVGVPKDVTVTAVTRASVSLHWFPPTTDGGARIIGYIVERKDVKEKAWVQVHVGVITEREYQVKGLKTNERYQFRVVAKNAAGIRSLPSEPTTPVVCKDEIAPPTVKLDYKLKDVLTIHRGQPLHVLFHVKGKPVPEIAWTKNKKLLMPSSHVRMETKGEDTEVIIKEAARTDSGQYVVTAKNNAGAAEAKCTVTVLSVPSAPVGPVKVWDVTKETCRISWDTPADDGGSPITNYFIEKADTRQPNEWVKVSAAIRKTEMKVTKLQNRCTYVFRIRACNYYGPGDPLLSAQVLAKHPFDPPSAPTKPTLSGVTREQMLVSWGVPESDGGAEITNYVLEKKELLSTRWSRVTKATITDTKYLVTDLDEGTEYEFRVAAENAGGRGKYSVPSMPTAAVDPPGPPGPVQDPRCLETTETSVTLAWDPPREKGGSRIVGYLVEMLPPGGDSYKKCHIGDAVKVTEFTVPELLEGKPYRFRVTAINEVGPGAITEVNGIITPVEMLEAPVILLPQEYKRSQTIKAGEPIRLHIPFKGRPEPEITWVKEDSDLEHRAQVENTRWSTTLSLVANRNDLGKFELTLKNKAGVATAGILVKVLATPGAPENVEVKGVTKSTCIVDWDTPSKDGGKPVKNFVLQKKQISRKTWDTVDDNIVKTAYRITNLVEGNQYTFRVIAENDFGFGDPGEAPHPITAMDPVDQPDPPKKVDITEITPITVSLAWVKPEYDGGSRITSYVVEKLRTSVEDSQWERCTVLSLTRCTVTDLVPHEEYRFRVSAQNYGAISEPRETTAVVCKEQIVPASIDLTAVTSDVLILKEGQDFILKLPYHGMPTPAVTWYKGLGVFRETIRVVTKTVGGVTQLIFRKCEKMDGGTYTVVVANPAGKQTAEIQFKVLGKPGPPVGPITFEDMTPETATLNWQVPLDDGGGDITNYVVEKSDNRGASWVYVSSNVKRCCLRVTKLVHKKEYLFRVSAENRFGVGKPLTSESAVAKYPYDEPTPPYDLKVSEVTKESMLVSWHTPESDGGAEITGYTCERRERNSNRWVKVTKGMIRKCEVHSYGLLDSCEYEHRVYAHNAAGTSKYSESTGLITAVDPVGVPPGLKVTHITRSSVSLAWREPDSDGGARLIGYIVERNEIAAGKWVSVHSGVVSERTYTLKGLKMNGKYEFRVTAKNAAGRKSEPSPPTPPVICKDDLAPPTVSFEKGKANIHVREGQTAVFTAAVSGKPFPEVTWNRGARMVSKTARHKFEKTNRTAVLTILECTRADAGEYNVRVKNDSGLAEAKCKLQVFSKPQPPTNFEVIDKSPDHAMIGWQEPEDDGGSPVTSYIVERCDLRSPDNWTRVSAAVRKTSYKVTRLAPGSTYIFRISAQTEIGVGLPLVSPQVVARHPFDTPSQPGKPEVSDVTKDSMKLTWTLPDTDGGSEILGYIVGRKERTAVRWARMNKSLVKERRYIDETVDEGLEYEYRITAENEAGRSKPSAPSQPTVAQDPLGKPGAPVVFVDDTTRSSVSLTWNPPVRDGGSRVTGYIVEMRKQDGEEWTKAHATSAVRLTELTIDKLTEGQGYKFRVSAINEIGVGEPGEVEGVVFARDMLEAPEVELDVSLKRAMKVNAGAPIRIYVPIKGKPQPTCTWEKDDSDLENRATIQTSEIATQLVINAADRRDAGRFKLTVENSSGKKEVGVNVKVYDTPGPPEHVRVRDVTKASAIVSWAPPIKDGGRAVGHYILEKREQSRRTYTTVDANVFKTSYRITNLVEGNIYFFRVLAVNEFGVGEPGESAEPCLATDPVGEPDPPKKLCITEITPMTVSLEWQKPDYDGGSRITSYVIEKMNTTEEEPRWEKCSTLSLTRITVADLIPNDEYKFRVSAQNAGAMSVPEEVGPVTAKEQVEAPHFDLTDLAGDTFTLKEGADVNLVLPFTGLPAPSVEWFRGLGPLRETDSLVTKHTRNSTSLIVRKIRKADGGKYRVVIKNKLGEESTEITFNIIGKPGVPSGPVEFEEVGPESITLNWQPPTDDGGSYITNYVVERTENRGVSWVYVSSNVKRANLRVTKLVENKEYIFRISAENKFGVGPALTSTSVVAKLPFDPPDAPTNVQAFDTSKAQMSVSWEAPANDGGSEITGYICERKERGSRRWVKVTKYPIKKLICQSAGFNEGSEYEFRVYAINAAGAGKYSESSYPAIARDPVGEPRDVKVVDITRASVTLSWHYPSYDGGARVIGYIVERMNQKEGTWVQVHGGIIKAQHFKVKGLVMNEKYTFRVLAKNAAGIRSKPSPATPLVICKDELIAPKISLDYSVKDKTEVFVNKPFDIGAAVSGKPEPEIVWTRNDRVIVSTEMRKIKYGRKTVLTVKHASREDAGIYKIVVKNPAGQAEVRTEVAVLAKPDIPAGPVRVTDIHPEGCVIGWEPPEDTGGAPITNFIVERCEAKSQDWMLLSKAVRSTRQKITRLTPGMVYQFRIFAQTMHGISVPLVSDPIEARYPFDPPSPPMKPVLKDKSRHHLAIKWDAPETDGGSPITGYIVERKERTAVRWEKAHRGVIEELQLRMSDVWDKEEYQCRVIAENIAGKSKPSPASEPIIVRDPSTKPSPPEVPEVTDKTKTSISIRWGPPERDGGSRIVGYVVEMLEGVSLEGDVVWLKCHQTSMIRAMELDITELKEEQPYRIRVSAINEGGSVGQPAELPGLVAPRDMWGNGQEQPYRIRVSAINKGGSVGQPAELPGLVAPRDMVEPPQLHMDAMMKRAVTFKGGDQLRLWCNFRARPMPDIIWEKEDSDLENRAKIETIEVTNQLWCTQLIIEGCDRRDAGKFQMSMENSEGAGHANFIVKVLDTPGAPLPIKVMEITATSALVTWTVPLKDGGRNISGYTLEIREQSRRTWKTVAENIYKTNYRVPKLVEGNFYYFRVMAVNDYGAGLPAETTEPILAMDPVDAPESPRNLRITEVTPMTVSLAWQKPEFDGGSRVTSYLIEVLQTSQEEMGWVRLTTLSLTRYTATGLTEFEEYKFRVSALNVGAQSNPAEVGPVVCKELIIPAGFDLTELKGDTFTVKEGKDLTVALPLVGVPRPKVTWMRGLGVLRESDSVVVKTNHVHTTLLVRKVRKADRGKYTVKAENHAGEATAEININVLGRPAPPVGPVVFDEICPDAISISWQPPTEDGGASINNYVVEKSDNRGVSWVYVSSSVKRTSLRVPKLVEGTEYLFRISAENKFGVGEALKSGSVVAKHPFDPPSPPLNIKVSDVTKESMRITWDKPAEDGGSEITGYVVEKKERTSNRWMRVTRYPVKKCEVQAAGLNVGSEYDYRVYAVNAAGNSKHSEPSGLVLAVDPVSPPQNVRVLAVSRASVTLAWHAPLTDGGARIVGYIVERLQKDKENAQWVYCHPGIVNTREYVVKGLIKEAKYEFRIRAKNAAGILGHYSDPTIPVICKDDISPPKAQLDLNLKNQMTYQAGRNIELTMHFAGKPEPSTEWHLGRKPLMRSDRTTIIKKEKTRTLLIKNCVRADTGRYTFTVKNDYGEASVSVDVNVQAVPGVPMGPLKVSDVTPENCVLTWDTPADNGGLPITNYIIDKCDVKVPGAWMKVSAAVRKTTHKVTKLKHKETYIFRVRAVNYNGPGEPLVSEPIIAKHSFDVPTQPSKPVIKDVTCETCVITWEAPESDGGSEILGYVVERKEHSAMRWQRINRALVRDTELAHEDLTEGLEYDFRVAAENEAGRGKFSPSCMPVLARDPVGKPQAPQNAEVLETTRESVSLLWQPPYSDGGSKIYGYIVEKKDEKSEEWKKAHSLSTIKTCELVVPDLEEGKGLNFRVSAVNEYGVGEPAQLEGIIFPRDMSAPPECKLDATLKRTVTVKAGVPLRFYVPVRGKPFPKVTWVKDDSDLENRANIEITENATQLVIVNTNRRDAGRFELTLENPSGTKTVGINVKVIDTPGPPEHVRVRDVTRNAAVIVWAPPLKDGSKSITHYILEKKEPSRRTWTTQDANIVKTSYRITNLVEGNNYLFRVLAVNDIGIGEPGETPAPILAMDQVAPPEPPKKLQIVEITPISVTLTWTRPDFDGGSRITSYLVEKMETTKGEWERCTAINATRYCVSDLAPHDEYTFRVSAQNVGATSDPAEIGPVVAKEQIYEPTLDLSQIPSDVMTVKEGIDLNLPVLFRAWPKPRITWLRGLGELRESDSMTTKNTKTSTTLIVRKIRKADAGTYAVVVLGKPSPCNGPVDFEDVGPESITLNWKPPDDDGGAPISNYVVEKSDNRGISWVYVSSNVKRCTLRVTKLTENKEYIFRISAENKFGTGKTLNSPSVIAKLPFGMWDSLNITYSTDLGISIKSRGRSRGSLRDITREFAGSSAGVCGISCGSLRDLLRDLSGYPAGMQTPSVGPGVPTPRRHRNRTSPAAAAALADSPAPTDHVAFWRANHSAQMGTRPPAGPRIQRVESDAPPNRNTA